MERLGTIEKVDLREVWSNEARDFTKWLALEENLSMLGNSIGIEINLEERESSVGNFNVDIYATEEGTGRKIIIENQLEDTNHDHLGKIITYASGKDAEVIIWIVKRARDEHKQAIEWLNQHTDEKIGFFLLEIELWRIGDSLKAPKFNVIERPNDWAKTMKATEGISETNKLQLEFWQGFKEYAFEIKEFSKLFTARKAMPQMWYDLSVGSASYHIELNVSIQKRRLGAGIYIPDDKNIFEQFRKYSNEIEKKLESDVEWIEASKASRMIAFKNGDIKKEKQSWQKFYDWYINMAIRIKEFIDEIDLSK